MARLLDAMREFGPKLELNHTAQLDEIVDYMASRTGLNKSEVLMVLQELNEVIIFFNKRGTPVKLAQVGTFTPSINRHGLFRVSFRADSAMKRGLNAPGVYGGPIRNEAHIGLGNEGFRALWDEAHPEDPLDLT